MVRKPSSPATSQPTVTASGGIPPGSAGSGDSGSGASRVHSTNPSGAGLPEATPQANGSRPAKDGPLRLPQPASAGAASVPARPARTRRRLTGGGGGGTT